MNLGNNSKILLLSTSDTGGAGEAMVKLGHFLKELGYEVSLLVKKKYQFDDFVIKYYDLTPFYRKPLSLVKNRIKSKYFNKKIVTEENYFFYSDDESTVNISAEIVSKLLNFKPQFIFSGWTAGFINSTDLLSLQKFFDAQVYTIPMDMNHYTGGCHYAWDCKGYINGCNENCPAILSHEHKYLAKSNFEKKMKNAELGNFKIISGSGWTLKQSQESKIYKNQTNFFNINSLIDTRIMNPKNRTIAKSVFNMGSDKFYILMGCKNSNDPRKGFDYLIKALEIVYGKLSENDRGKISVIIVSKNNIGNNNIPFGTTFINFITDYRLLSLLYQASDVFVNSSVEDSGPMMVSEALACGTPVVGFDMGVVNNMVINNYNGYKATLRDSVDLAKGIKTIFELTPTEYNLYSQNSVLQVKEYSSFEYGAEIFNEIFKN